MILHIKNKWVSLRGQSYVEKEDGSQFLFVKGKFFSFTKKKFVQTVDGQLLFTVRNKFWTLFARKALVYDEKGELVSTVRRKIFSLHDRYFITSKYGEIEIKGNILCFDYHISLNGKEIGHISRMISLRDYFVLDISDDYDIPFFVALVIAIDNITDRRTESND